ncbi:MAG: hypothetical protein ABSG87_07525 [Verrucomicrobiota bacterium]|jgi:uncharacterized protein involved in exopolysaccharide biosynthesis
MFRSKTSKNEKEHRRFYLLPGQGGRPYRRKQKTILVVSIATGLIVSGILVLLMYLLDRARP